MRTEGISEGSALPLAGIAFEHRGQVRAAASQWASRPVQNDSSETAVETIVDTHEGAAPPPSRLGVEFHVPYRLVAIGSEHKGVIDRNGDGMINLRDLPFDYFQIARQSSRGPVVAPPTDELV